MNYSDKTSSYYANIRHDLISLISKKEGGLKVLEIGAAYGETLHFLKEQGIAAEAVGVELYEDVKNKENYKPLDRFIFANIEETDFPEYEGYFDIILLPDVLEHLVEPKKVLAKVKKYLNPDGELLVSMPNIRHYSAIKKIVFKGDFRYEESGIFDYTHMRFYCRKNIKELLENSGFAVQYSESSIKNYKGKSGVKIINKLTFGLFEEFFSTQYFFSSKIK
ncbi:class I SAM-dependent methyltransferase [Flavobacterium arcticum]|uniref:Class I SAM-dependent methyltransferase n=1 Tax=Flavobacterium arcticum TaxID=1784713 RepID=A0A345HAT0_9FLAO|nr:class I SAM-dependent methyltransferase [Flavobacterium arcticum]AXG73690.1 class I SAM-dependent methyltransferase [Flavobacterium arcticum]KAF2511641.1 class I SAM-dependent methyltransferase [Flavobacterium arcticum]